MAIVEGAAVRARFLPHLMRSQVECLGRWMYCEAYRSIHLRGREEWAWYIRAYLSALSVPVDG